MKKLIATIIGVAVFTALLLGFLTTLRHFSRPPSVILTSTCDPPCWHGIEPGKTAYKDVPALLERIGIMEKYVTWEFDKNDTLISARWSFQRPIEDSSGTIYFNDEKQVSAITIRTINSITIAEIFEKLGEPENYITETGTRENKEKYLDLYLFYPSQGYMVECVISIETGSAHVEVTEETPIFRVTYFAPDTYYELLPTRIFINKAVNARSGSSHPWTGLGIIPLEN